MLAARYVVNMSSKVCEISRVDVPKQFAETARMSHTRQPILVGFKLTQKLLSRTSTLRPSG